MFKHYILILLSMGFCAFARPQTTWVKRSPVTIDNEINFVTWNGEMFIAIGRNGEIRTSTDGDVWVKQESGTLDNLIFVCSSANMSVAVSDSGVLFNSPDGVSWTQQNGGNSFMRLYSVAGGDGHFVAVGGGAVEYCGLSQPME